MFSKLTGLANMFISHKDSKIIAFSQVEWECRLFTKKIPLEDYWSWLESVTTDGVPDYSGEDYSVEEVDQVADTMVRVIEQLRELSPLWDMYLDGVDFSTVKWNTH